MTNNDLVLCYQLLSNGFTPQLLLNLLLTELGHC